MAHKKGVGSSKNGRESQSKRLGVKILVASPPSLVTSLFVNAAHSITLVKMYILEKTTPFMHE